MDYSSKFDSLLYDLKPDGRYRSFIDLERQVGALPTAIWRQLDERSSSPCGAAMTTQAWVSRWSTESLSGYTRRELTDLTANAQSSARRRYSSVNRNHREG